MLIEICVINIFFLSTGGNCEGVEAAPGLPPHLSHHQREALLVDPEVQEGFLCVMVK